MVVEELQILVGCDASTAEKVLTELETRLNRFVKQSASSMQNAKAIRAQAAAEREALKTEAVRVKYAAQMEEANARLAIAKQRLSKANKAAEETAKKKLLHELTKYVGRSWPPMPPRKRRQGYAPPQRMKRKPVLMQTRNTPNVALFGKIMVVRVLHRHSGKKIKTGFQVLMKPFKKCNKYKARRKGPAVSSMHSGKRSGQSKRSLARPSRLLEG